ALAPPGRYGPGLRIALAAPAVRPRADHRAGDDPRGQPDPDARLPARPVAHDGRAEGAALPRPARADRGGQLLRGLARGGAGPGAGAPAARPAAAGRRSLGLRGG